MKTHEFDINGSDYFSWLNGRDDTDRMRLTFLAEHGNDEAKTILEQMDKGEIDESQILSLEEYSGNVFAGFKQLFEALSLIYGHPIGNLEAHVVKSLIYATTRTFKGQLDEFAAEVFGAIDSVKKEKTNAA